MCVYSMVYDHYRDRYPDPYRWTRPVWDQYRDLIDKAKEIDKVTKQPDCEKPEVAEFEKKVLDALKDIDQRLSKIEKA